jgi:hypothetical protein
MFIFCEFGKDFVAYFCANVYCNVTLKEQSLFFSIPCTHVYKIRIPKESSKRHNEKCYRLSLIEPVHRRYC